MNRRISFLVVVLAVAGIITVRGAFSQVTIQPTRKVIKLAGVPYKHHSATPSYRAYALPGGADWIDPKTAKFQKK